MNTSRWHYLGRGDDGPSKVGVVIVVRQVTPGTIIEPSGEKTVNSHVHPGRGAWPRPSESL